MSYLTSSSSPQASSRRNEYDVPYQPKTGNVTDNTYDYYGEEFDIYGPNQSSTDMESTNRRQQGFSFCLKISFL